MLITEHRFQLTFGHETVAISIEARQFPKLPSKLIFAQSVLKDIQLFSKAYGIVCINKRLTYITNEILTSKHDGVYERYTYDLHLPKRLAHCKLFTQRCSEHPSWGDFTCGALYCTKQSYRVLKEPQCHCKLFVKDGPTILKSQCVIKLSEFTRVGTLILATIYLQLIQNRYRFRNFTVLQCSHQHCVQTVDSDVEVVRHL